MIAEFPPRATSGRSEHIFYVGMSLVAIAVTVAGFARTYFLRPFFHPERLSLTVHVHGAAFTAWVLLLLLQTTLVSARRTDIHRTLGWAGAGLAAFMIVIALDTAVIAVHQAIVCCNAVAARAFLAVPIADMIVFGTLVGCAIAFRRRAGTHKRLMLLATLAILDAATSRWPLLFIETTKWGSYVAIDTIVLAVVAYDTISRKRLARAYAWGVPLVLSAQLLRELVGPTQAWQWFARLIVG
jgi:hypothetical protein